MVIGGGVIGLTVAWRAAQCGLKVRVVERDRPGAGATAAAAGMIAPVSETTTTEPELLQLGLRSAELYPQFVNELEQHSDGSIGYRQAGTLIVARDRDDAEALEREFELRHSLGLSVERLRPSELLALEPALAPTVRTGLRVDSDHSIDPLALVQALLLALTAAGGALIKDTVKAVLSDGSHVSGVHLASGESIATGNVVMATGCQPDPLEGTEPLPVRPVKGQVLILRDPNGPGLLRRTLRGEDCYIVPRGDGRYVIGASMEERGFDRTINAGVTFELLRAAYELVPGIAELELSEIVVGHRPGTPDNLPIIGPGELEGVIWATGHFRSGILLAPITGELVATALSEGEWPRELVPLQPGRFTLTSK